MTRYAPSASLYNARLQIRGVHNIEQQYRKKKGKSCCIVDVAVVAADAADVTGIVVINVIVDIVVAKLGVFQISL